MDNQRNQLFYNHTPVLPNPSVDHNCLKQLSDPLIVPCYLCCGSLAFFMKYGWSVSCWVKHGLNNNTAMIWQSSRMPFATSEISTFLARCVTSRQLRGTATSWETNAGSYDISRQRSKVGNSPLTNNPHADLRRSHEILFLLRGERNLFCLYANEISSSWGNIWGVRSNCKCSDWERPKKLFHLDKHA